MWKFGPSKTSQKPDILQTLNQDGALVKPAASDLQITLAPAAETEEHRALLSLPALSAHHPQM